MNNLISVIVPAYNVNQFIEKCVYSILQQTYNNFELIIVNDGSTDGTADTLNRLASEDNRIIVVHQTNQGVSVARNKGIKICNGDYVCFIDSDDYISEDYLEVMTSNLNDCDCVACGYTIVNNDGEIISHPFTISELYLNDRDSLTNNYMYNTVFRQMFFAPFSKLYKASIIKTIEFDSELVSAEDIVFNLQFLSKSNSVHVVNYEGYHYKKTNSSVTVKSTNNYSPRSEHSFSLISDKIDSARREFGVSDEWIRNNHRISSPMKYFLELTNLYCQGTPYSYSESVKKIKEINSDKAFINDIKSVSYCKLTKAGKIAFICAYIKEPFIISLVIKIVMKLLNYNR